MPQLLLGVLLNLIAIGVAAFSKSLVSVVLVVIGALAALWGTERAHPSSRAR